MPSLNPGGIAEGGCLLLALGGVVMMLSNHSPAAATDSKLPESDGNHICSDLTDDCPVKFVNNQFEYHEPIDEAVLECIMLLDEHGIAYLPSGRITVVEHGIQGVDQ